MYVFAEYSLWLVPICLIIGLATAFVLYHNDKKLESAPIWVKRFLFISRTLVVSFLLFLLLGPVVEMLKKHIEKPTIILLHDNSASLLLQKDSAYYKTKYLSDYQQFSENLQEDYFVDSYTFDETFSKKNTIDFSGKETNIANALNDITQAYQNQNIGAIVLASDGIFNAGENPKYVATNVQVPIYTVALGDTIQSRDNLISNVLHNQIAFRNNPFPIQISIESHGLQGKLSKLTIADEKNIVYTTQITPNGDDFYKTIDCKLESATIGKKIYTISIQYFDGEISKENNTYRFAVDVLESRQKIGIIYESVHPDVAAIKRAIETNKNYECMVSSLENCKFNIEDCNCLILCGLPSSFNKGKSIFNDALQKGIPTLLLYNSNTNIENCNSQHFGIEIQNFNNSFDEAKPNANTDFELFSIDESTKNLLQNVPPLVVPYGTYNIGIQARTLCFQTIGTVQTERPLIAFSQLQNVKIGCIFGEGIWRWRLYDYKMNESFSAFDSFINTMIAYLSLTEKKELFRVNAESIFFDNQDITFTAELYDKSFEPLSNKTISLSITNEAGSEFPFTFNSTDNFYTLNAGKFPEGNYSFVAKAQLDNTELIQKGSFYVMPLVIEYKQTKANHALLRNISQQTNGKLFYHNEFEQLQQEIKNNTDIVSIAKTTKTRSLLLDLPLILTLIILAASTEWFFRKYYATY